MSEKAKAQDEIEAGEDRRGDDRKAVDLSSLVHKLPAFCPEILTRASLAEIIGSLALGKSKVTATHQEHPPTLAPRHQRSQHRRS